MRTRVAGLPRGEIIEKDGDIAFDFNAGHKTLQFVARIGVVEQIIAALGRICAEVRPGTRIFGGAERVHTAAVQVAPLQDMVLLELMSDRGVPSRFAMTRSEALEMAAELKTRSERPTPSGQA